MQSMISSGQIADSLTVHELKEFLSICNGHAKIFYDRENNCMAIMGKKAVFGQDGTIKTMEPFKAMVVIPELTEKGDEPCAY